MTAAAPSTERPQSDRPQRAEGQGLDSPPQGGRGGGRGGRGGRAGGGGGGYGSVVDAGDALFALSPIGTLVVFKPNKSSFELLAEYKVADGGTYAYPVISENFVYIKDKNALIKFEIK